MRARSTHTFSILHTLPAFVLAMCVYALGAAPAAGQGTVQIVVGGIPPVLETPYLGDLDRQIDQGLFNVQLIYISPSRQPRAFRLRLTLEHNGDTVLDLLSEPNAYEPGVHTYRRLDDSPAIDFPITYGELVDRLDARTSATGLLAEGTYTLTIEAVPEEADLLLPSIPGMAVFEVRYAEPPILLSPFDQTVLTSPYPVFSWAPIVGAPAGSLFEYELLIVEVLPGQASYRALESNRELVRIPLLGQTAFAYTAEQLPLEKDHTYAWQVRARDAAGLMPVLDAGETEYNTFTVGVEGLGGMVASWSYPVNAPFIVHTLANPQELDPGQTELYFDGLLPIEVNGAPAEARFEGVVIDAETQAIIAGAIVIEQPLAIEVALNPLTDAFSDHAFVPAGSAPARSEGLLLEWNSPTRVDRDGVHPAGTHPARVSYTGLEGEAWTATYSPDIALNLAPFGIDRGRIDFAADGVARAYADASGFHVIDRSDPVIAQIPDRLIVGEERLAYVPLKRNGVPLVAAMPLAGGTIALSPLPGTRLEAVIPAFRGPAQGAAPRYEVLPDAVVIQSGTGLMVSGSLAATTPETAGLDAVGVPIAPERIVIGIADGEPRIQLEGRLTLFGAPIAGSEPVVFTVDGRGRVAGDVAPGAVAGTLALDAAGWARLAVESVEGRLLVPLFGGAERVVDFTVAGAFQVVDADLVIASAAIAFAYSGAGQAVFTRFEPAEAGAFDVGALHLGATAIEVAGIDALWLSGAAGAPRFSAALDAGLALVVAVDTLRAPLQGVELRDTGLHIAPQDINDAGGALGGKQGGEQGGGLTTAGAFDLRLIGIRLPETRLVGSGDRLDLRLDFDARLARLPLAGAAIASGTDGSVITGESDAFAPCGFVTAGPMALVFDSARMQLTYERDTLVTWIEGEVAGVHEPLTGDRASGSGTIAIDLADGRVVEGSARLDDFEWAYPAFSPLFVIDVVEARLDGRGVTFFADSTFAGRRLSDDAPLRFTFSETFKLGLQPARANTGRAEVLLEATPLGRFDENGFSIGRAMEPADLPEHIPLAGIAGALWLREAGGDPSVTIVRSTRGLTVLRVDAARLQMTHPARFSLPVAGEITVNDAFEIISGELIGQGDAGGIATSIDPLRVHHVRATLAEGATRFEATLEARIALPDVLVSDSTATVAASFRLVDGEATAPVVIPPRSWYEGRLRFSADTARIGHEDGVTFVTIDGGIASPFLHPDSTASALRFTAGYREPDAAWAYDLALDPHSNRTIPFGAGSLALDPMLANRLQANPLPVLSLAGLMRLPARLGEYYTLGLALEVGPAGVYLGRPYSGPEAPVLIEGLLTQQISRLEWRFDEGRRALVASLDGAYESPLLQSRTGGRATFRGMEIGMDGEVFLGTAGFADADSTALSLLSLGQSIDIIPNVFRLDSLALALGETGLRLSIAGSVDMPAPSERLGPMLPRAPGAAPLGRTAPTVVTPSTASLFPTGRVAFTVGLDGTLRQSAVEFAGQTLRASAKPAFQMAFGDAAIFQYEAAELDFSPWRPAEARLLAAARLFLRPSDSANAADSSRISRTDVTRMPAIPFGRVSDLRRTPGVIVPAAAPIQYFTAFQGATDPAPLVVGNGLYDLHVGSVTLPDASSPTVSLAGLVRLNAAGISGGLSLGDRVIGPAGLVQPGHATGASTLSFDGILAVQTDCFELEQRRSELQSLSLEPQHLFLDPDGRVASAPTAPLSVQAYARFGAVCGDTLQISLTDGWFDGRANALTAYLTTAGATELRLDRVETTLAAGTRVMADLRHSALDGEPSLDVTGFTFLRDIPVTTTGHLRALQGRPSLALFFSPAAQVIDWIPGLGAIEIAGGGLFYRPATADLEPVSRMLNERHNGAFSAANPAGWPSLSAPPFALYLPADIALAPADSSHGVTGAGLFTITNQFTTFDLRGTLLQREDELDAALFLAEVTDDSLGTTLQGQGALTVNFTSTLGGFVHTAFQATPAGGWSAFGYGDFLVNDALPLSGRYQAGVDGLLLDLTDMRPVVTGSLTVPRPLQLTAWFDTRQGALGGFTAIESDLALLPGVLFGRSRLTGSLVRHNDEQRLYAASNLYVDVPFVYTGPLDPWLSVEGGQFYAGDARNMTFRRMINEGRQHSAAMPELAEEASIRLQEAVRVLRQAGADPFPGIAPGLLTQSSDTLLAFSARLLDDERAGGDVPETLTHLAEGLFADGNRPARTAYPDTPATSEAANDAWLGMTTAIATAARSAETDLFGLASLAPRSLLWLTEEVEIPTDLNVSPVVRAEWPNETPAGRGGFEIDATVQDRQTTSLLAFKERNDALDLQFTRAVGTLELNLVNLKIARTPDQPIRYAEAVASLGAYHGRQADADWSLAAWATERSAWLAGQERVIERDIEDQLGAIDDKPEVLRRAVLARVDRLKEMAAGTGWINEAIADEAAFRQRVAAADPEALKTLYRTTGKWLWFDAPAAALLAAADSLTSRSTLRADRYAAHQDSIALAYGAFTRALDPMYDTQTAMTTTLYGMAEEYKNWRTSMGRLDPEGVNLAFQFLPYRGNYRLLADDLIPPSIESMKIGIEPAGYRSTATITWTAQHPIEIVETSIAIQQPSDSTSVFASVGALPALAVAAFKRDGADQTHTYDVTLRVRGAGGLSATRSGRFTVPVDPDAPAPVVRPDSLLTPLDATSPPAPVLAGLAYSAYFSDEPNTLWFTLGELRDAESGIASVAYRIVNEENVEDVLQDWTEVVISRATFAGRTIETGLPVQERNLAIRVEARVENGAGLTAVSHETLRLSLDDTPPVAALKALTYFNPFNHEHPNSLLVAFDTLRDAESGIQQVEYVLVEGAETNLAEADWQPLIAPRQPQRDLGARADYIPIVEGAFPDRALNLSAVFRVTNGAGLQSIARQTIQIPGRDATPPTEPQLTLSHTGFYDAERPSQLHILLTDVQDVESGVDRILFRVLDGSTGQPIQDWNDFTLLDPTQFAFYAGSLEHTLDLPRFGSGRPVIVEARAVNHAGVSSRTSVAFLHLDVDDSPPPAPALEVYVHNDRVHAEPEGVSINVGPVADPESGIGSAAYRLVDPASQSVVADWQPLPFDAVSGAFPGARIDLDPAALGAGEPELQVRVINGQGLSAVASQPIQRDAAAAAPTAPEVTLFYTEPDEAREGQLYLVLKPIDNPLATPAAIRYRLRDADVAGREIAPWQSVPVTAGERFAGRTIVHALPDSAVDATVLAELVVENRQGQAFRSQAALEIPRASALSASRPSEPTLGLFYYDARNSIQANTLELAIGESFDARSEIVAVTYRIVLTDAPGETITLPTDSTWSDAPTDAGVYFPGARLLISLPELTLPATAQVEVRLENADERATLATGRMVLAPVTDDTAPVAPAFAVSLIEMPRNQAPARLRIVAGAASDPETGVAEMAVRLIDPEREGATVIDWTPLVNQQNDRLFAPAVTALTVPSPEGSLSLVAQLRATNGLGLERIVETPVVLINDQTPPSIEGLTATAAGDGARPDGLVVTPGLVADAESVIERIEYRVTAGQDTAQVIQAWTPLATPRTPRHRAPAFSLPLPSDAGDLTLDVAVRAVNAAGLEATERVRVSIDRDETPPQMPPRIEMSFVDNAQGIGYLLITPGAFRDAESLIAGLDYRMTDAANDAIVFREWTRVPAPNVIRATPPAFSVPRTAFPFDGAREVLVAFRAHNGAGLYGYRQTAVSIPGDTTPPEAPALEAIHLNAYDARRPNSLELRIGPASDAQSSIVEVAYRLRTGAGEALAPWTPLAAGTDGRFPGSLSYVDLPFIATSTRVDVDVRVVNSAGLVATATTQVDVVIQSDVSPPELAIALHFFNEEIALVLDELSDPESRIHQVDYRFLDNVDQTVLTDWAPVFEIAVPQARFERQIYGVDEPAIRSGRTLKVEVRATNGAGLQTTVSKTVLFRSPGIGQ